MRANFMLIAFCIVHCFNTVVCSEEEQSSKGEEPAAPASSNKSPTRADIAKVALESATRIEAEYKSRVEKKFALVQRANKVLLQDVANGTRAQKLFDEIKAATESITHQRKQNLTEKINAIRKQLEDDKQELVADEAELTNETIDAGGNEDYHGGKGGKGGKGDKGGKGGKKGKGAKKHKMDKRIKDDKHYIKDDETDIEDARHEMLDIDRYKVFDEVLNQHREKELAIVQKRVDDVVEACNLLSRATSNKLSAASALGKDLNASKLDREKMATFCEDRVFKALNVARTSAGFVRELFAEAELDEEKVKASNSIKAKVAQEQETLKSLEAKTEEERKTAIAGDHEYLAKARAAEAGSAQIAAAGKEAEKRVDEINAYIAKLQEVNATAIASKIKKNTDKAIGLEKANVKKDLDAVLKNLAASGAGDLEDLSEWEASTASAEQLRTKLNELNSEDHERQELLARITRSVRSHQESIATLEQNATDARLALQKAAAAHFQALKSIGAPADIYKTGQAKIEAQIKELKRIIAEKSMLADDTVVDIKAAILHSLSDVPDPQPLDSTPAETMIQKKQSPKAAPPQKHTESEASLSAATSTPQTIAAPLLGCIMVMVMVVAAIVIMRHFRFAYSFQQKPLLG